MTEFETSAEYERGLTIIYAVSQVTGKGDLCSVESVNSEDGIMWLSDIKTIMKFYSEMQRCILREEKRG